MSCSLSRILLTAMSSSASADFSPLANDDVLVAATQTSSVSSNSDDIDSGRPVKRRRVGEGGNLTKYY